MSDRGEAMLATPDRGRLYVMQPVRCGMQGGTVRFSEWGGGERGRRGGVMRDAKEHLRDGVLMHPDALLIAAAPELLEALERLLASGDVRDAAEAGALKQARAAIAKAVGSGERHHHEPPHCHAGGNDQRPRSVEGLTQR